MLEGVPQTWTLTNAPATNSEPRTVTESPSWMVLDSNYTVIDSVQAGNGYATKTNPHDISMYSDGHYLLLINDTKTMDMTAYGGQANASVTGVIIQELDAAHDVVWEWSGWDHFPVTDAVSTVSLAGSSVDYVHSNAVSRDDDGNIILSSRHLSEVSKINYTTGDFVWRLNGEHNEFTFVNDNITGHFSYQHDARRIANGNITLYNNGNFLAPQKSSAKEYEIDEVNKIATLAWYYEHPDVNGFAVFGPATGSTQRLPNGNTLIDWGTVNNQASRPSFTEVDNNKNIVWEFHFEEYGQKSYRAHKNVWIPCEMPKPEQIKVNKITDSSAKVKWAAVNNAVSYDLQYRKIGNNNWKLKSTTSTYKTLKKLKPGKSYQFQLRTHCMNGYTSDWTPLDTFTTLPARYFSENDFASITLHPNPVNDFLTIQFDFIEDENISVRIYDLAGRTLLETPPTSSGNESLRIDVSKLPSAFYFAEVKLGSEVKTTKFVKQ